MSIQKFPLTLCQQLIKDIEVKLKYNTNILFNPLSPINKRYRSHIKISIQIFPCQSSSMNGTEVTKTDLFSF